MDDAMQNLVDEARRLSRTRGAMFEPVSTRNLLAALADALEAAQRPRVGSEVNAEVARALRAFTGRVRSELDATRAAGINLGEDYLSGVYSALQQADDHAAAALNEAAQRPTVEYPHESGDVIVLGPGIFVARDGSVLNWRGENYVPQRPPVGPEVREEIRAVVGEQLTKAGLDLDGPPYSDDGETQWPFALQLRDCLTSALLARFSVPKSGGSWS